MRSRDFPWFLTTFLSHYLPGQKNVSTHTISSYRDTFKLFLTYCEKERSLLPEKLILQVITKELIVGFLD